MKNSFCFVLRFLKYYFFVGEPVPQSPLMKSSSQAPSDVQQPERCRPEVREPGPSGTQHEPHGTKRERDFTPDKSQIKKKGRKRKSKSDGNTSSPPVLVPVSPAPLIVPPDPPSLVPERITPRRNPSRLVKKSPQGGKGTSQLQLSPRIHLSRVAAHYQQKSSGGGATPNEGEQESASTPRTRRCRSSPIPRRRQKK